MNKERKSITVPKEAWDLLKEMADKTHRSISQMIVHLVNKQKAADQSDLKK